MDKTTVYFPAELKESLRKMAREIRISEAELIRRAVGEMVARRPRPRPRIPLSDSGLGDASFAERADELLDGLGRQ